MEPSAILFILIGSLLIASRGPLIVAPRATLRFFTRFIATDARVRGIALALAPLAAAMIMVSLGDGPATGILAVLGWLFAGVVAWLLVAPSSYRRIAGGVIAFSENSVDEMIIRLVGLLAVAIGGFVIYAALQVV